jgi:hypothetical protein
MRNTIENTAAFKSLEGFRQNIWRKKDNIRKISEELIIARQLGYEAWKAQAKPCDTVDKIVNEILTANL